MAEGRRWSVDNPSPTMKSFTAYINEKEGEGFVSEAQVAATFIHHRDWQQGHAAELVTERAEAKKVREAEAEKRKEDREAKKKEKDEAKAKREAEAEQKRKDKEAAKAAKEAEGSGADGDDSDSASEGTESRRTRRKLNTNDAQEPVAAGVSEASF
jgi:C4-dicarboxylate-specific signal transduction histidine kinase